MKVAVLRFDAPLVSFGAPAVDQNGVVQRFPALSMITGLLANALGCDHRDAANLDALQERIRYAARVDRRGEALRDYQTVDLGAAWMRPEASGWTTRGRLAQRGGASADATHQRYRHYWADSVHTVAVTLLGADLPSLEDLIQALRAPARPLFIGRKCCLPASPLLVEAVEGASLVRVLAELPRPARADRGFLPVTWWDGDDSTGTLGQSRVVPTTDERDWQNRVHIGRRFMREGHVDPPEAGDA